MNFEKNRHDYNVAKIFFFLPSVTREETYACSTHSEENFQKMMLLTLNGGADGGGGVFSLVRSVRMQWRPICCFGTGELGNEREGKGGEMVKLVEEVIDQARGDGRRGGNWERLETHCAW